MGDRELQRHVEDALGWEPSVDAAGVAVSVDNGVVTLRGDVASYASKSTAGRVTLRVYGVKAVANDLDVRLSGEDQRTDSEIAQAAVNSVRWNAVVPTNHVSVVVGDGWITLSGTVGWNYQKTAAVRAVRDLAGVRGVTNDIVVQPQVKGVGVRDKIEAAFKRSAGIDARRIAVVAHDGTVILTGHVRSWAEREEAERVAWAAPGVTCVDDRLSVTL